jgi:pimeloyl-ACP methyl ester carboxylesterase
MSMPVPYGVREDTATLPSGVKISYLRAGQRPSTAGRARKAAPAEPLLLLHGLGHSARAWDRVILPLAENHDVVALDLPGCGKSDKPDTDYSLGAQAAAVRYFLDELEIARTTVVGHSLGGGVAMTFSYLYPDRVGRLALVSSGGLGKEMSGVFRAANLPVAPKYVMQAIFHPRARIARSIVTQIASMAGVDPLFAHKGVFSHDTAQWLEPMEDPATRRAFLSMLKASTNVLGQAVSALDRLHLAGRYPVLIVWGADDRVIPVRHGQRAAQVLPNARIEVFKECGHMPQVEMADRFVEVLRDWMRTTSPSSVGTPLRG